MKEDLREYFVVVVVVVVVVLVVSSCSTWLVIGVPREGPAGGFDSIRRGMRRGVGRGDFGLLGMIRVGRNVLVLGRLDLMFRVPR